MTIKAEIVLDSINPDGSRLTTWLLSYPRFIHSEIMTHRLFSRNAASSRAIPFHKLLERTRSDVVIPIRWGANQKGMQADKVLLAQASAEAHRSWERAFRDAAIHAEDLHDLGCHKQIVNRLIEPFTQMTILLSTTKLHNFFGRRAHKDAEDNFMVLAYNMLNRYLKSSPRGLEWGEWHIPYGDRIDGLDRPTQLKVATARAARLSYLTHDGEIDLAKDIELHDSLKASFHMSPFEHSAQANPEIVRGHELESNFGPGWLQYRKTIDGEHGENEDLEEIYANKPDWIPIYE